MLQFFFIEINFIYMFQSWVSSEFVFRDKDFMDGDDSMPADDISLNISTEDELEQNFFAASGLKLFFLIYVSYLNLITSKYYKLKHKEIVGK